MHFSVMDNSVCFPLPGVPLNTREMLIKAIVCISHLLVHNQRQADTDSNNVNFPFTGALSKFSVDN